MEKKIIDILESMDANVDLSYTYDIKQIKPSDITGNTTNDVKTHLNDVDLSDTYKLKNINTSKITGNTTNDVRPDLSDADLSTRKNSIICKSNTLNFDSIMDDNNLGDINLEDKPRKKNIFKIYLNSFKILAKNIKRKSLKYSILNLFSIKFLKYFGLILLCIITLLFIDKKIVEIEISSGYGKILSLKNNSGSIDFVEKQIKGAKRDFLVGNILFTPFLILPTHDVKNGYYVLKGGKELSKILDKSLNIYKGTKQFIIDSGGVENIKITNLLSNIRGDYGEIMTLLYNSILYYDKIGKLPNKDLNDKLVFAKTKLKSAYKILDIINKDYDVFLKLLGHNSEKKYLVVFQNNDEIRPTGGFIGSLATVTIRNGKVTDFVKEDVYSYEWDINKVMTKKEPAPEGLNRITDTFGFRDSNYFIGFEASSNSIKSFIDKVDRHIDGIVYINQNTILDFLKYTGGIKFDQLNETITEDNFSLIISTLVEAKVFKVGALGTPKQVLFDFANVFTNVLKEKKDYYAYLNIIIKNIKSRDLVIYSFNPEENNLLWKLGLNGKINYQDTLDFAYPVYTSVGGNKSDRYIDLEYKKSIVKNTDCSIDTNLSINKTHMFSVKEEQKVNILLDNHQITDKTDLINIQGKGENRSYVRVILPKDAIIEPKDGMNIIKNDTFQQVDYYQNTRLLETSNFDIKYRLPNPKCSNYTYKLYKQPGIRNYSVEIKDKTNIVKKDLIGGDYVYGGK